MTIKEPKRTAKCATDGCTSSADLYSGMDGSLRFRVTLALCPLHRNLCIIEGWDIKAK